MRHIIMTCVEKGRSRCYKLKLEHTRAMGIICSEINSADANTDTVKVVGCRSINPDNVGMHVECRQFARTPVAIFYEN